MGRHSIRRLRLFAAASVRTRLRAVVAGAMAFMLVAALAVVGVFGGAVANAAALPTGITGYDVLLNGTPLAEGADVKEGDTLTLRVRYDTSAKGQTVNFSPVAGLGAFTVANPDGSGVPAGNTAIDSVVTTSGVSIAFKDAAQWPAGVVNGIFGLDVTVSTVTESGDVDLKWNIGSEEQTFRLVVLQTGDKRADVTPGYDKTVNYTQSTLNSRVTVAADVVTVNAAISGDVIQYTLVLNSATKRDNYQIRDQLPKGMAYALNGSSKLDVVSAVLTTWDSNGLNLATENITFDPAITTSGDYEVAGDSFSGTVNVPGTTAGHGDRNPTGPSTLVIKYNAKITDTVALQAALQTAYNAKKSSLGGVEGGFSTTLINTATFGAGAGDATRTATVTVGGTVPGNTPGSAFSKDSDWSTDYVVEDAAHHLNVEPQITYSLTASLGSLKASGVNPIAQNVVLRDALPAQATWDTGDAPFITVTGTQGTTSFDFGAASCPVAPVTVASMAVNGYLGKYCVDGQVLYVNLGQDTTTSVTIKAKAKITAVQGLAARTPTSTYTKIEDATAYLLPNTAQFYYKNSSDHYDRSKNVTVVALPASAGSDGLNDSAVFTKTGPNTEVSTTPGTSVKIPFTFTINTAGGIDPDTGEALNGGNGIDPKTTTISDHVDTTVFDISDLTKIDVTGTYDGTPLTATDFVVARSGDDLNITLSAAGQAKITPVKKAWKVTVKIPTKIFDGKQSLSVTNSATLLGAGSKKLYWDETTASATSFGNEAEVRKTVYNRGSSKWVDLLEIPVADAADHTYVFGIDYVPHGSFNNTLIDPVYDVLPASLKFCGFVSAPSDIVDCDSPATGPQYMGTTSGGHVQATWNSGSKTVTIDDDGNRMVASKGPFKALFAVKVIDTSADIVNTLTTGSGDTIDKATIRPKKPTPPGGGGPDPTPSTTPTTTPATTPVTTPTTATTTTATIPTKPTVVPSSATSPRTPPPPTNVPPTTVMVDPDQCTDIVETGFEPGETVTITVTGANGQYELSATADENGTVTICLAAQRPETVTIEVLGENQTVVREVVIGVQGTLPNTGVPVDRYVTWALLLLGAGAAFMFAARRRGVGRHGAA